MNKQCRKALAVLSAVIVTATSLTLEAKQNPNNLAYAKTLKEIEQEKKEKQDEIDKKKEELKSLSNDLTDKSAYEQTLKEQISLINGKMVLIDSQMTNLIGEITDTQNEIAELENEIAEEEVEIEEGLKVFKARIRALYVHGNDSLLSALIGADSFYDALTRIDLIKRISKHDDEMITNLREEIQSLTNHKQDLTVSLQTLNLQQTEIEVLKDEFNASKKEMDTALSDNHVEIEKIVDKQMLANNELKAKQGDLEKIEQEEEDLIQEAIRKAMEEEKKQKEEEAKRQAELEARRTTTTTTTTTTTVCTTVTTTTPKPVTQTTAAPVVTAAQSAAQSIVTEPVTQQTTAAPTTVPTTVATTAAPATTTVTTVTQAPPTGSMFAWPAPGYYTITSPFGYRIHPIRGTWEGHKGIDISGGGIKGAAACAAGNGTVIKVCNDGWGGGYGNNVVIYHGNGYSTLYAHLQYTSVSVGQQVTVGQQIGAIGSTGDSTGPHLHFEVRINDSPVNPQQYLP